jgi:hypothetical protein
MVLEMFAHRLFSSCHMDVLELIIMSTMTGNLGSPEEIFTMIRELQEWNEGTGAWPKSLNEKPCGYGRTKAAADPQIMNRLGNAYVKTTSGVSTNRAGCRHWTRSRAVYRIYSSLAAQEQVKFKLRGRLVTYRHSIGEIEYESSRSIGWSPPIAIFRWDWWMIIICFERPLESRISACVPQTYSLVRTVPGVITVRYSEVFIEH